MFTKANDFSIEQRDIRHDKELIFDKKFFHRCSPYSVLLLPNFVLVQAKFGWKNVPASLDVLACACL